MKMFVLAAAALMSTACAAVAYQTTPAATSAATNPSFGKQVQSRIVDAKGSQIGFAHFTEGNQGVVIRLEFNPKSLTPGWHGTHLHQKGDCADFAAGFQASGAHVGHSGAGGKHGLLSPTGPEAGDLANIFVADTEGPFAAEIYSPGAKLDASSLLGPQGSALIIHANVDDHKTQPIGGAGARVACAAIKP